MKLNKHAEEILSLYEEGKTNSEICRILKIDKRTVRTSLEFLGIDYAQEKKEEREKKLKQIVKLYREGASQVEIEKLLNMTRKTIREVLKNSDVSYRDKSQALILNNKNYIDETVFDDITNPDALYVIGFIYADGHISYNNQYAIEIKTHIKDIDVLEKIKSFFKTSHSIKLVGKDVKYPKLRVFSKVLVEKLKGLGFTSRKSWNLVPHESLKHSKDFWRGVLDGDGYVSLDNMSTGVCGTYETCEGFRMFAMNYLQYCTVNTIKKPGKCLFSVSFTSCKAKKVLEVLYTGANLYLERKYRNFLILQEEFYDCKERVKIIN